MLHCLIISSWPACECVYMLEPIKNTVLFAAGIAALLGPRGPVADAQPTQAWIDYEQAYKNNQPLPLPDYTHAGFALCPESVTAPEGLPVLSVKDFGAVIDDEQSDWQAIQAAIVAGEKMGGAVIQFEAGKYLVGETPGQGTSIRIQEDNIVLRGTTDADGRNTELYMHHHLVPEDPSKMWTTPGLFEIKPDNKRARQTDLCKITSNSAKGAYRFQIDDPSALTVGGMISLESRNIDALDGLLAGLKPWDIWTETIELGAIISGETHRIVAIEGNTVHVQEPIQVAIHAKHGWTVRSRPLLKGFRAENITFRGNSLHPFAHHKNAAHDTGWTMFWITRAYAPVVENCRFVTVSTAIEFKYCYGATSIHNEMHGHQGHNSIAAYTGNYGTLIAFCLDFVEGGSFHGFAANAQSVNTVIYHCKNSDRGFDWHASWPYCTLIDKSSGGLVGNGGSALLLPNHMQDLTFWNMKQTAGKVYTNMDWWEPRRGKENYSGPKVVYPRIIGSHGLPTTFLPEHCLLIESHGKPVEPASLFEAQLELRDSALPQWLVEGKKIFNQKMLKAQKQRADTPHLSKSGIQTVSLPTHSTPACTGSCKGFPRPSGL